MSDDDAQDIIPHSLPDDLKFTYLAEGAANVVYKIEIEDDHLSDEILTSEIERYGHSTPPPTELEDGEDVIPENKHTRSLLRGKLLRLRKDRADSVSPLRSQRDFERFIKPLFDDEELILSTAIEIGKQLVARLNSELKTMEELGTRPVSRYGIYLRSEIHGMIMDDIGEGMKPTARTLELKPKWLLQSADAPEDAQRCRTCALKELRAAKLLHEESQRVKQSMDPKKTSSASPDIEKVTRITGFCPLDLVSQNKPSIEKTLEHYFQANHIPSSETNLIVDYLKTSPLLQKLKTLQGSLQLSASDTDFLILMTLRDCSLFLSLSSTGISNARLGDLDLKSAPRVEYWRDVERQLCDEGWYDKSIEGRGSGRCALER